MMLVVHKTTSLVTSLAVAFSNRGSKGFNEIKIVPRSNLYQGMTTGRDQTRYHSDDSLKQLPQTHIQAAR